MQDEQNNDGLSRRQALTRLGVGAAAVWSAPVVTGLTMPAAATGSPPTSGCSSCDGSDGSYPNCGDSGPLQSCFCAPRRDQGGCYCAEDFFCSEAPPSCTSQGDCDSGVCVDTFCGAVCADACGTSDTARFAAPTGSGPTASGR